MDDSILAAVEAYLADFVTTKAATYLSVKDASFGEQSILFAEALVEWLGPGGDEAFLVFFLLAGGKLRDIVSSKFTSPLLVRSNNREEERRRQMTIASAMFLANCTANDTLVRRGFVQEDTADQVARNDAILHRLAHEAPAICDDEDTYSARGVLASQRAMCVPWMSNRGLCLVTLRPNVDYRTLLMGELAHPWEVLPPPYGPYVPARRL